MRKLIDPVWGGVYQYSTDGDWDHAHFEKIMSYQADDMRVYAQAYLRHRRRRRGCRPSQGHPQVHQGRS